MLSKVLFLSAVLAFANAQKTPVYVYYESLCPDSQAFITKQLYPTMKLLKDHVDLHLIPYGKSSHVTQGSDVTFTCNHGPNECYGNKIQACAIKHIQVDTFQDENTRETLIVEYINCLMSPKGAFPDQTYTQLARDCATAVQYKNFEGSVLLCANSTEGSKYLQEMGELTKNFARDKLGSDMLKNVPTITIRESFDPSIQTMSLTSFSSTVCKNLPKPMPAVCKAFSSASAVSSSFIVAFSALFAAVYRMF